MTKSTLELPTLVNNKGFLLSARDAGLTTLDSVCELLDNSLDAGANHVDVRVEKNGPLARIIVTDDGMGIPAAIEGEDGRTYDGIAWCLSFGGRAPAGVRVPSIGKFGAGLTYAACCQSLRTDVYSKTAGETQTRHNRLDLEALSESNDLHLPPSDRSEPPASLAPNWAARKSGTMVVLDACDQASPKTPDKIAESLMGHLGMVYRRFITAGRVITVQGKPLVPKDPLFTTPGGWHTYDPDSLKPGNPLPDAVPLVKEHGSGPGYIVYDNSLEFPDYPDATGAPQRVHVKIVWLDIKAIRKNPLWSNAWMAKHGLNEENQGFYLMRNDRQIGEAESFGPRGIFVRNADLNYFRGEISFPPELDRLFGVQQNKSRFSLKEGFKTKLDQEVGKLIRRDIKPQTREFIKKLVAEEEQKAVEQGPSAAESVMKKAAVVLKAPAPVDPGEVIAQEKKLEAEAAAAEAQVVSNPALSPEEREAKLADIKAATEKAKLPYAISTDVLSDGCFYHVKRMGKQVTVVLNTGHEFFPIYQRTAESPVERMLLELLLMSAAHGEAQFDPEDHTEGDFNMCDAIDSFRHHWSVALNVVLKRVRAEKTKLFPDAEGDLEVEA